MWDDKLVAELVYVLEGRAVNFKVTLGFKFAVELEFFGKGICHHGLTAPFRRSKQKVGNQSSLFVGVDVEIEFLFSFVLADNTVKAWSVGFAHHVKDYTTDVENSQEFFLIN